MGPAVCRGIDEDGAGVRPAAKREDRYALAPDNCLPLAIPTTLRDSLIARLDRLGARDCPYRLFFTYEDTQVSRPPTPRRRTWRVDREALIVRWLGAVTDRLAHDHGPETVLHGIHRRGAHAAACGAAGQNERVDLLGVEPGHQVRAEED